LKFLPGLTDLKEYQQHKIGNESHPKSKATYFSTFKSDLVGPTNDDSKQDYASTTPSPKVEQNLRTNIQKRH